MKPFIKEVNESMIMNIQNLSIIHNSFFFHLIVSCFLADQQKGGAGAGRPRFTDRNMVRKVPNRRDRRPQENGGPKNKRARRSTSDQEEDSNSEDEEREEVTSEINKKTDSEVEAAAAIKQEGDVLQQADQEKPVNGAKETGLTNGVKVEEEIEQKEGSCHINGQVKKEDMETEQSETKPYTELHKPCMELPSQTPAQTEQVSVTMTTTEANGDVEQKPKILAESSQPAAEVPPPQPVKRKCPW